MVDNTICIGQQIPEITGTQPTGGSNIGGSYTYKWEKLVGVTWTQIPNVSGLNYAPSGLIQQNVSYRRKVENSGGFEYSLPIEITAIPLPTVLITATSQTIAPGGTLTLNAQGADTWLWYSSATTASVNISTSGSYYVRGTSTATTCTNSDTIQITEVAVTPGVITGNEDFCVGNQATNITGTVPTGGSGSGYLYKWQIWNGSAFVDTNPLKTTQNLTSIGILSETTRYRRLDADPTAPTTWSPTNEITKTIRPLPDVQNIVVINVSPSTTVPPGASVVFTASGATSYRWNTFNNATTNPITQIINADQVVTLTAVSSFGCEATKTQQMTATPLIPGAITTANLSVCNNGIPALISSQTNGSGGTGSGHTYKWYENGVLVQGQNGLTYQPNAGITQTTVYRRTVVNAGVESSTGAEVSVSIAGNPTFGQLVVAPSSKITPGTSVSITANATTSASGTISYAWAPAGGTVSNGNQYTVSPNSNTMYTVTATDSRTCSNSSSVTIQVSEITPGTISPVGGTSPASICRGESPLGMELVGYSGGSDQYSFQWQEKLATASQWQPVGTNSVNYAPSGQPTGTMNYRVIVTDVNNTNHSRTTSVFVQTVNQRPTVTSSMNKTSPVAYESVVRITGSGGQSYQFILSPSTTLPGNGNTLDFQPLLGSNTVLVIGADANGCKDTSTMSIVANLLIKGRQTSVHPSLCAGGTLTQPIVIAPSSGGSGAFSYEWYMGTSPISASINTLIIGNGTTLNYTSPINQTTYFKRRTIDQGQGFDSSFVTINVNPIPSAAITRTPSNSPMPDGATVTLQVPVVSGGTYTWAPTGGTTNANQYTVAPLTTTTYTATVTNGSGCSSTSTLQVVVDPLLPGTLNNQALCGAQSATAITGNPATGGDPSNYVYGWESRPLGGTWTSITGVITSSYTPNPAPTVTTDYRRTVTNLGVSKSAIGTLTVASNPVITVSPSATTINVGSSATLTASGALTYIWALTPTPQSSASVTVDPAINTTYSVTGRDQNGCEGSKTVTVTVVLDGGTVTTAKQLVCQGAIPETFTEVSGPTGGSGAYTYQWQESINGLSWTNISGARNPSFSPVQAITSTRFYRRMAFDGLTRDSSNAVTVNTVTKPTITASANIMTIPPGAAVQLSGDGAGAGNTSYQWFIGSSSVGTTQQVTVNPSITTSYILEGTSNEGCKNRDTIIISVLAINGGTISAVSSSLCVGNGGVTINNVSVASGGSGVFTYAWEVSTGGVTYAPIPGQSGTSLTYTEVLNGTTYFKRRATDNAIVQYSNVAVVNVNPLPNILASTGTRNVPPNATVTLSASGGSSYTWSPQGNFSRTTNIGQTVSTEVPASQVFTVQGTDPATGCVNQDTILITVRPLVGGQIGVDQFICSGGQAARINSLTGASGGSGSYQYQWEKKEQGQTIFTDVVTATGATFIPPVQTVTTTYRRRVTDMGITANSTEVVITVSPNPNPPVTKDTVFCQSSNFSLQVSTRVTISPGNSLRWYESATGGIFNINSPIYTGSTVGVSEYFVSQANSTTGCESVRSKVSITTRALPNSPVVPAERFYCEGGSYPPMSATMNSPQFNSLVWYDSDGTTRLSSAPTPNTAVSMQKTYYVSEVDPYTCESPKAPTKSIVYLPDVTITVNQEVSCFGGSNGQLTANPSGGLAPYNYQWSTGTGTIPGANQSVLQGVISGNYQIRVTDDRQCERTVSRSITQPSNITISPAAQNPLCYGGNGSITITASGGTPVYQYSFDNGVTYQSSNSKSLPFGTYRVKVKDSRGCENTTPAAQINLVQPAAISSTFVVKDVNCWGSSDGSLTVIAVGGNAPYTYLWNDPNFQTTPIASGLDSGSYNVTVYDLAGCNRTFTKSVGTPKQIKVSGVLKQDLICFNNASGQISITATGGNRLKYRLNSDPLGPNSIYTGLSAANYTFTVTDTNNCFVDYQVSRNVTLTQPDSLIVQELRIDDLTCKSFANGEVEVTATGGNTKSYKIRNVAVPQSSHVFENLLPGGYFLTVSDNNNCQVFYKTLRSFNILEPDSLYVQSKLVAPVTCNGYSDGSLELFTTGGTQPRQYSLNFNGVISTQDDEKFDNLAPGAYSATLTDANNCPFYTKTALVFNIIEPAKIQVQSLQTNDVSCYNFGDGTVLFNAIGGNAPLEYSLFGDTTITQLGSIIDSLLPGSYIFQVSDSNSCPMEMTPGLFAQFAIDQPDPLVIYEIISNDISCHNFNDGSIGINAVGGNAPLRYSLNSGLVYDPTNVYSDLVDGIYFITATDTNNCPVVNTPQSVTSYIVDITNPDPLASAITVVDALCHGSLDGSSEISITGGTLATGSSYQIAWRDANLNIVGFQELLDSIASGMYTVEVRDDNQCLLQAQSIISQPDSIKVVGISSKNSKCYRSQDGEIVVNATGGSGLLYSIDAGANYQIPSIFSALDTGIYSITITDANSCASYPSGPFQVILTEPDSFYVSGSTIKDVDCFGDPTGSILIEASGGNLLEYSINNGATWQLSSFFDSLVSGIYTLDVRDSAGCIGVSTISNSATVSEPAMLVANATALQGVKCEVERLGSAQVVPSGGTLPYKIVWETGDTNFTAFGLQGFEYEFTITDSHFCVYEGLVKIPTTDADCDSIPDFDDGFDDFDGDGIPNLRDEDSDGDRLPDIIERDLNRDGIVYDDCDDDGFPDFLDVDYCTLFIPSVFTPNGDGANDYFIIPGIEGFEDNSLVIYDRNGNMVFNQAPYKNGFNGVTNGTAFINSQDGFLPTGTYYYVLSIPSISVREIGYFYIQR